MDSITLQSHMRRKAHGNMSPEEMEKFIARAIRAWNDPELSYTAWRKVYGKVANAVRHRLTVEELRRRE